MNIRYSLYKLLYCVKQNAKEKAYKFVWVRDGNIFCRQNDNSALLKLSTMEDIENKIVKTVYRLDFLKTEY